MILHEHKFVKLKVYLKVNHTQPNSVVNQTSMNFNWTVLKYTSV